jgi:hypothetical protein
MQIKYFEMYILNNLEKCMMENNSKFQNLYKDLRNHDILQEFEVLFKGTTYIPYLIIDSTYLQINWKIYEDLNKKRYDS